MAIKLKYTLLVILPMVVASCFKQPHRSSSDNQPEMNRGRYYMLLLDSNNSNGSNINREKYPPYDSIFMQYYSNDSILFVRYRKDRYRMTHFCNNGGKFIEDRLRFVGPDRLFDSRILGIDSIVTFSKQDTAFLYKSTLISGPFVEDYIFTDCQYTIKKVGDHYVTKIQSMVDTTYKEMFFYDMDYNVFQYINIWKNNKYVYIRK